MGTLDFEFMFARTDINGFFHVKKGAAKKHSTIIDLCGESVETVWSYIRQTVYEITW